MPATHSSPTTIHGYARRQPETTVFYVVVHDHLATLHDYARASTVRIRVPRRTTLRSARREFDPSELSDSLTGLVTIEYDEI